MNKPGPIIAILGLVALCIYLFVQAPEPLPEEGVTSGATISMDAVLTLVAAENDVVRALWTREIVGKGKEVGLAFDENWRDEEIHAGPLPALFLREAATSLEKNPIPLSLFLGSDFPISPSNNFVGSQIDAFEQIKATGEAQFFVEEDTQLYTAMFADYASVEPCVSCHNEHPDSPKTDWVLDDVMGATTWAYPKEEVTMDEFLDIMAAVRQGFSDAYNEYLTEIESFDDPPEIGENWPRDGYYVPSAEVFMSEFASMASSRSVDILLTSSADASE